MIINIKNDRGLYQVEIDDDTVLGRLLAKDVHAGLKMLNKIGFDLTETAVKLEEPNANTDSNA